MAFPTKHWAKLQFTLGAGVFIAVDHGLRDGRNGTAVTPDVVEFEMGAAAFDTWPNEQIGEWQASDNTHVYLYNFDIRVAHPFSVVARSFYSEDDANF
jgi:hypothetical protein